VPPVFLPTLVCQKKTRRDPDRGTVPPLFASQGPVRSFAQLFSCLAIMVCDRRFSVECNKLRLCNARAPWRFPCLPFTSFVFRSAIREPPGHARRWPSAEAGTFFLGICDPCPSTHEVSRIHQRSTPVPTRGQHWSAPLPPGIAVLSLPPFPPALHHYVFPPLKFRFALLGLTARLPGAPHSPTAMLSSLGGVYFVLVIKSQPGFAFHTPPRPQRGPWFSLGS